MLNNEAKLMKDVLIYEDGHMRRTKHILMVHSLAKAIGGEEGLSIEHQQVVQGAAILHDIAIKVCKEKYNDASLKNQQIEAPSIAKKFLTTSNYMPSYIDQILELIYYHHDYSKNRGITHQILIEADLIVNCLESQFPSEKASQISKYFRTKTGRELLNRLIGHSQSLDFSTLYETHMKKYNIQIKEHS